MKINLALISIMSFIVLGAYSTVEIELDYPEYFPEPVYNFTNNKLSAEKIELGRKLFFDPVLSKDSTISCASCHSPYNSFSHTDHQLSHGINDQVSNRNAPAIFNVAWQKSFMWDGAINHLDTQPLAPIEHPKEMNETLEHIIIKLKRNKIYVNSFAQAFKDSIISVNHLLKSLSQFQLTLVSSNSGYDKVRQGLEKFNPQEEHGYELFKLNCNSCHAEPLFSTYQYANNGLPVDTTLQDPGRWAILMEAADSLMFKIPSLRNLSYTYPYMHDGRFKKLSQVLNHYTDGIVRHPTLSPELKDPIILSSDDKADLIAFLLTLNDKEFVFNPKHQFPKELLINSGNGTNE